MRKRRRATTAIAILFLMACDTKMPKEKHKVFDNGAERGVRIEVILKGGGSATLICPKFDAEPFGAHGRECYLDSYNKGA